jgi:hypothetical protein
MLIQHKGEQCISNQNYERTFINRYAIDKTQCRAQRLHPSIRRRACTWPDPGATVARLLCDPLLTKCTEVPHAEKSVRHFTLAFRVQHLPKTGRPDSYACGTILPC